MNKQNWRSYFSLEELESAYNKIIQGIEPNEEVNEEEDAGSDSCPSDDNLEIKELYKVIYVRKKRRARELIEREEKE